MLCDVRDARTSKVQKPIPQRVPNINGLSLSWRMYMRYSEKIASRTILLSQERAELFDRRKVSPLHVSAKLKEISGNQFDLVW